MVHMVMLSTEHSFLPGSAQYQWLANDLQNVDRKKTPFVIVGGHRAMYCSNRIDGKSLYDNDDFVVNPFSYSLAFCVH